MNNRQPMSALLLGQWNAHLPLTTNTLTSGLGPYTLTSVAMSSSESSMEATVVSPWEMNA